MQKEFKITRVFDAPREVVWAAFTEPEMVKHWWGPKDFTAPSIKINLRVGGKYIFAMQGPAGSEWDKVMYSAGTYKEIVPMEKIVCTDHFSNEKGDILPPESYGLPANFPKENIVMFTFESMGDDKTKLTILYVVDEEVLEIMNKVKMREGWESSLDKLAEILE
ncbi:MAG: Activator of Hsp90 ATPase 1 family protein [Parcubacteria group bacterium Gr01-1014_13]|nr:MAG: Activator of Hsp90 ATPase 1 family protein [Parcubacteria group bacterium Gr01-1014_13]